MRLDVHRKGTKLFFVTFTVAGRRRLLSRLIDERHRPELTALGELVRAGLRALHLVRPAIGISDYVIMPDHVHFILRIDYLRDPIASPVWLTHRLLDALECVWGMWQTRDTSGTCGPRTPAGAQGIATPADAQGIATPAGAQGESGPSEIAPQFMATFLQSACAAAEEAAGYGPGGAGASPARSLVRLFDRSPYIELAFDPRQLKAARHYIRLNPARALWRLRHPDCFARQSLPAGKVPGLAALPGVAPVFHALGDLAILGSPFLFHVRLTLKKTVPEHAAAIDRIVALAQHGGVPVSGFISPGEKEALRRLKAEPRARFIKLLPAALTPRYDPSAEDSRELAARRLLILGCFPETPALSPLEMRRNPAFARQFRQNCLRLNDYAAAMCAAGDLST